MKYGYKIPQSSIAEYVDNILVLEDFEVQNPFILPLFANGCPTLVFQTKKALLNKESAGHFTLFGQTIKPGAFTIHEDFTLIAYFFKPHSLVSLFNLPGNELSDAHVDLNMLKQSGQAELQEKLLHCSSADDMILLLNNYVLNLINKKKKDTSRIEFATSIIKQSLVSDNLKTVQDSLCVTEKTLRRMFESNLGISPRLYKRICQFNAAFQQLNLKKFSKLSDIAYENGYADQSHFVRTFKEFTNITPSEYLNYTAPTS
jgi:AraC-like DNA-binding protein